MMRGSELRGMHTWRMSAGGGLDMLTGGRRREQGRLGDRDGVRGGGLEEGVRREWIREIVDGHQAWKMLTKPLVDLQ